MSTGVDDIVRKPARTAEMSTTIDFSQITKFSHILLFRKLIQKANIVKIIHLLTNYHTKTKISIKCFVFSEIWSLENGLNYKIGILDLKLFFIRTVENISFLAKIIT